MMKQCVTVLLIFLAAVLSVGAKIQDINPLKKQGNVKIIPAIKKDNPEELARIAKQSDPIMQNILVALNEKNHAKYIRDFNQPMKSAYPKDVFIKSHDFLVSRLGKYISKEFIKIGTLDQHYIVFYRAKFSKTQQPVTIRLMLEQSDNQLQVALISYDSPLLQDSSQKKK